MIEEEGIVVELAGGNAKVAILKKSACESCVAAGACHPQDTDRSVMEAANPIHAAVGQSVKVVIAPQVSYKTSSIQYGLPVAVLIGTAILAKNVSLQYVGDIRSDIWALCIGMLGLSVSFIGIWMYNRKVNQTQKYRPVIVEIISHNG